MPGITDALVTGLLAGFAIAMPVGAMSVLIVTLSAQRTLRTGMAAALGVATADGLYALAAVLGGAVLAPLMTSVSMPLTLASAAVLALIALHGLVNGVRARGRKAAEPPTTATSPWQLYAGVVGLTLVNPVTIVYFAALVIGHRVGAGSIASRAVFVAAAFAASASWQTMLACGGALLGRLLTSHGGRLAAAIIGNAVILVLAARLAWTAMQ